MAYGRVVRCQPSKMIETFHTSFDPACSIRESARIEIRNASGFLSFDRLNTNGFQVQCVPDQYRILITVVEYNCLSVRCGFKVE